MEESITATTKHSQKPAARTARGNDRALKRLETKFAEGDYYEAQQLIKMLMNRYLSQSNSDEAVKMLLSGMQSMLAHKQPFCATELGILLIKIYKDTHIPVSSATLEIIANHFANYPEDSQDNRADFLKAAIRWSAEAENTKHGNPLLHDLLAEYYTKHKAYGQAQGHFIRGNSPEKFAQMLVFFAMQGYPSEQDLFVARVVFQYLCLSKVQDANRLFEAYLAATPSLKQAPTPLTNLVRFLLGAAETHSTSLFTTLRQKYTLSLQRDPSFAQYMDQIGICLFNIQPASGIGGLFSNFMKAFLSGDTDQEV